MAITKTDFINFTRCPRYIALENLKKENLTANLSYEEYKAKEKLTEIEELYLEMVESVDGLDLNKIDVVNKQLEAMLDYYKNVEIEAAKIVQKYFGGKIIYAVNTKEQKKYSFNRGPLNYLCYVDIYNEVDNTINIIEVKATTSKKYTELQSGYPKKTKYSIWHQDNNIHILKDEIALYDIEKEMPKKNFTAKKEKLFDRWNIGSYFYDLAVQRFIIEGEQEEKGLKKELPNIHYYLAVLNENYIFDGTYIDGKPIYSQNKLGEELITFFKADEITKKYLEIIKKDVLNLEKNLANPSYKECPLGSYCGYKKQTMCKYFKEICGKKIPSKNSSLSYINNGFGFLKEDGTRIKGLDLINENYLDMLDIPESWLHNPNHLIQRNSYQTHQEYLNKEKIQKGLEQLEYPIYHLDFETFPCPLPRFKGEWPYIQSPFEFSLHIEHSPGICDKEKDNIIFLAKTTNDEREDLIKCLLENINPEKGTLFAQNVSFEKGRIKELATIFPKYANSLMKIYNRGFDLLWLLNNNKELYKNLGFNNEDCETINYYHENLSGSFSIKKTLPVFTNLTYQDLQVKNGTEAIIEYANYDKMSKEERTKKQEALKIYCRQDTWAMVEILNALRKKVL